MLRTHKYTHTHIHRVDWASEKVGMATREKTAADYCESNEVIFSCPILLIEL